MAAISVQGVVRTYGSLQALKDVSLDVQEREFVVLLGPSGCGKTTLLRAIAGLDRTDAGRILIGERDVTGVPARERGIAMVFQNYAVFPHMSVFDNIAFGLRMKKAPETDVRARVGEVAGMMRIGHLVERWPAQLSGGQRQRVAVARALAVRPAVLLMDEPLSNLDALLRLEMRAELKGVLTQSKTTTIYVTHDQVEAMSLADRVAVMKDGVIVQYDVPMRVYADPRTRFVGGFIGSPPMNFVEVAVQGTEVVLGGKRFEAPRAAGASVTVGIRAEDMEAAADGIAVTVRVVEPLGPNQLVTLSLDDAVIRLDAPNTQRFTPGETIRVAPRPGALRWFDTETGVRIA